MYKIIDNDNKRCQKWMAVQKGAPCTDMIQTIGLEKDGDLIAVAGYNCFSGSTCQQHLTIARGEKVIRKFVWFIYFYPFVQLGIKMLIAIMPEDNANIVRLAKNAGFIEKYRIDGDHPDGDLILCTLKKSDCRFLNIKIKG